MNTIREGSTGEDVKKWQSIIGTTPDGIFGPNTKAITIEWQLKNKLVGDGVVGPATWGLALGQPIKIQSKTPQASADNTAYEIAKRAAPSMPEKERQYVLTVARGEGFYGKGWGSPSANTIAKSQEYGLTGYEGQGSNNWGAVQGQGSAGGFSHVDYHADGSSYVGTYKRYNTPEEGFLDMARIILKGGKRRELGEQEIKAAINKGSLRDAVFTQHKNGYFELAPEKYLSAVMKNYNILTINNDWKELLSEKGTNLLAKIVKIIGGAGLITLVGYGAWRIKHGS